MTRICWKCGRPLRSEEEKCPDCGTVFAPDKEERSESWNGLAITGLICSLVSVFVEFNGIVSMAGIIFSAVGLSQINRGKEKGRILAAAGLIIGILSVLWTMLSPMMPSYM